MLSFENIPLELLTRYHTLSKRLGDETEIEVREEFYITVLKIKTHNIIDQLKEEHSNELMLELNMLNHKIECYENRQNGTLPKSLPEYHIPIKKHLIHR